MRHQLPPQTPDLIFLDIRLENRDGMSVAAELRRQNFQGLIVFLTNYPEYMPEAFKVYAFRFLVKPVRAEVLAEVIRDAAHHLSQHKKVAFPCEGGVGSVWLDDILYIEAMHNYSILVTRQNQITVRLALNEWLSLLPPDAFFRCHRSYIVSLRHIESISQTHVRLDKKDASVLVSRRRLSALKDAYIAYLQDFGVIR